MQEKKHYYTDYLETHNLLSFATADENGNPFVRSVEYVNKGPDIFFLTDKNSTKIKHIKNNPNVAFTVDEDLDDWSKIQGIQMRGEAYVVEQEDEKEQAFNMLMAKFPQFAEMEAEGIEICIVKIKPKTGTFIDSPSGTGTRYEIQYE